MENHSENSYFDQFHNHQNKCRCCFQLFENNHAKIAIVESEQNIFEALTDIELKISSNLAKYLCSECYSTLQKFFKFREKARKMQKKYYKFVEVGELNQESCQGKEIGHARIQTSEKSQENSEVSIVSDSTTSFNKSNQVINPINEKQILQQPEKVQECFDGTLQLPLNEMEEQDLKIEMLETTSDSNLSIFDDSIEMKVEDLELEDSDDDMDGFLKIFLDDYGTLKDPTQHHSNSKLVDLVEVETYGDKTPPSSNSDALNFDELQFHRTQRTAELAESDRLNRDSCENKENEIDEMCIQIENRGDSHIKQSQVTKITSNDSKKFEKLIRQHNIRECFVKMERLDSASANSMKSTNFDSDWDRTTGNVLIDKGEPVTGNNLLNSSILETMWQQNQQHVQTIREDSIDMEMIELDAVLIFNDSIENKNSENQHGTINNPIQHLNSSSVVFGTSTDSTQSNSNTNSLVSNNFQRSQRTFRKTSSTSVISSGQEGRSSHVCHNAGSDELMQNIFNLKYACDICGNDISTKSQLRMHMRIHNEKKLFKCEICGKGFPCSTRLKIHIRTHTKEKPFECEICSKRFSNLGNFRRHIRIHTGEKLFECETCRKRFSNLSSFRRHIQIHTGEKPFKCEICSKRFSDPSNLRRHIRLRRCP